MRSKKWLESSERLYSIFTFTSGHPEYGDFSTRYPDFVVDVSSDQYEINDLLVVADYLITDYSSISYEFSLLQKPMIFFTYDLEEYKQSRGVLEGFEKICQAQL